MDSVIGRNLCTSYGSWESVCHHEAHEKLEASKRPNVHSPVNKMKLIIKQPTGGAVKVPAPLNSVSSKTRHCFVQTSHKHSRCRTFVGPLLPLYTTPMRSIISGHVIPHNLYADDSCMFPLHQGPGLCGSTEWFTVMFVQSWMPTNKQKLNPDETEFFFIGNERPRSKYPFMVPIEYFSDKINPAKSAWNPGVIFGKNFHLPLTCIGCVQLMRLPYPGCAPYLLSLGCW